MVNVKFVTNLNSSCSSCKKTTRVGFVNTKTCSTLCTNCANYTYSQVDIQKAIDEHRSSVFSNL